MGDISLKDTPSTMRRFLDDIHRYGYLVFGIYALGFLVWNVYLSIFSVFEYNLLQTRFIATGIIAGAFIVVFALLFTYLADVLRKIILSVLRRTLPKEQTKDSSLSEKRGKGFFYTTFLIFFIVSFYIFSFSIFPWLPQFLGGASPFGVSLIGTPEQISYLQNYEIMALENSGEEKSVQTFPVCKFYENQDFYLIGVVSLQNQDGNIYGAPKRVIALNKDKVGGLQVRGGMVSHVKCIAPWFFGI